MTKVPGLATVPYTVTAVNLRTVTVWIPSFTVRSKIRQPYRPRRAVKS
jgi:hypothetical protein